MFTLKDGQEFDYSLLFNAVAAQDAQSVVRALRPLLNLHAHSEIGGDFDMMEFGADFDEVWRAADYLATSHSADVEEILSKTLAALSEDIRGEVAAHLFYTYHDLSPDFRVQLRTMSTSEDQQTRLVSGHEFNEALQNITLGLKEADREAAERNLLRQVDRVGRAEKYDAYMSAAYAIEDPGLRADAIAQALAYRDSIPVCGDFDQADIRYHALLEIYGVSAKHSEIDLKMPKLIEHAQTLRDQDDHQPMNRQTYLARLTPVS